MPVSALNALRIAGLDGGQVFAHVCKHEVEVTEACLKILIISMPEIQLHLEFSIGPLIELELAMRWELLAPHLDTLVGKGNGGHSYLGRIAGK